MSGRRVVVCGSINADVTFGVQRIPVVGETTVATGVEHSHGGKGANQAHAAARSGRALTVLMVGAVGDDEAGAAQRQALADAGADVTRVVSVAEPTGQAFIAVDPDGGNTIIVAAGANATWPDDLLPPLDAGDVVVAQLEVTAETSRLIAERARSSGARLVLNAAPASAAANLLLPFVDTLIVNEIEACEILGIDDVEPDTVRGIAAEFEFDLVITRGVDSALVVPRGESLVEVPSLPAEAIDTVGAGDAFVGALAAGIAEGRSLVDACRRAAAAGAATVTVRGARRTDLSPDLIDELLSSIGESEKP